MSDFLTDLQERLKRKQKEEESIKAAELLAAQEKEEEKMAEEQSEEPIVETSADDEVKEEIVDEIIEDETVEDETVEDETVEDETQSEETVKVVEKEVPVEVEKVIQVETIPIELFGRILEHAHSNIRTTEGIKQITSKVQGLIEDHGVLSLDDYEDILSSVEEPEESTEKLYREGATATNPSTGEKLVYRSGKWRPCDECQQ